jgi:histidinol-phosphate aminotransferase
LPLYPKKAIAGLKTCVHGGINYAELKTLGINRDKVLDFSVSTNPFMPPPGTQEIISTVPITQYPDSQCTELRQKLSEKLGMPPDNILVGSGTTELIRLIAFVYLRRGDNPLIIEPTYGEYEVACRLAGTSPLKYYANEQAGFVPNVKEVIRIIQERQPHAVFVCNPNNPTGYYLTRDVIEKLLDVMDDGLLIIDEAYVAFVEKSWNSLDLIKRSNIIVLRSMTKDYGLPGLRLGYAVSHRKVIDGLQPALPPWNVNSIAQNAGVYVLEKETYLRESLRQTQEAKCLLTGELIRLGFNILPSDANYFLVKVGNAPDFRRSLLAKGILVRDCTSFGLKEYIRISPRTLPECRRFLEAIGGILHEGETPVFPQTEKPI